jgi:hypothetical protein
MFRKRQDKPTLEDRARAAAIRASDAEARARTEAWAERRKTIVKIIDDWCRRVDVVPDEIRFIDIDDRRFDEFSIDNRIYRVRYSNSMSWYRDWAVLMDTAKGEFEVGGDGWSREQILQAIERAIHREES